MGTSTGIGTNSDRGTGSGVGITSWAAIGTTSNSFQTKLSSGSDEKGPQRRSLGHKPNPGMESGASWARAPGGHQRTTAIGFGSPEDSSSQIKKGGLFSIFAGSRDNDASDWKRLKEDFIEEMRVMSKLRHPCVTTVMGKFIAMRSTFVLKAFIFLSPPWLFPYRSCNWEK